MGAQHLQHRPNVSAAPEAVVERLTRFSLVDLLSSSDEVCYMAAKSTEVGGLGWVEGIGGDGLML